MKPPTPGKVSHRKVGHAAQTAIDNERITRERVDRLESWAKTHSELAAGNNRILAVFFMMRWHQRIWWLLTGKLPTPEGE